MEVGARRAAGPDAAEVAALVASARRAVQGERGADQWDATVAPDAPDAAGLEVAAAGGDRGAVWLLGCIDEVPVGVAAAWLERWRDGRAVLRTDLVWVEPGAREVGVGEALVDELLLQARGLGATALEAVALPGQRELKNLFERFGLVARAIVVHKAVTDG